MVLRSSRTTHGNRSEDGFTLVEVLISVVLTAIIGTLIATLLIQVMRTSSQAAAANQANMDGQGLLKHLELAIRNSATPVKIINLSGGDQALLAQVRSNEPSADDTELTQRCVAYVFQGATGTVFHYSGENTSASHPTASLAAGNTFNSSGFRVIAENVRAAGATGILSPVGNQTTIDISFVYDAPGSERGVKMDTTIKSLWQGSAKGDCFS